MNNSKSNKVDNVYVNLALKNTTADTTGIVRVGQTYTEAILDNPSKYYASVVKLEIPLSGLPLMIFPNPTNPNTVWRIGVVLYDRVGNAASLFLVDVQYIVYNTFITDPSDPSYYWVYHYGQLVEMINAALAASYILAGSPGATDPPYVRFNVNTSLFEFVIPQAMVNAGGFGNWSIAWNNNMNTFFPSWNVFLKNIGNNPNASEFTLVNDNWDYDDSFQVGTDFVVPQEYPTVDYLNSVRKIVVTSNSLPTRKEYYPPPPPQITTTGGVTSNINTGGSNSRNILIDFQLELDRKAGEQRGILIYDANIYRLIDMVSTNALYRIDLDVFWVDGENNFYPLRISKNDTMTIKLSFFDRKLFRNYDCDDNENKGPVTQKEGGYYIR